MVAPIELLDRALDLTTRCGRQDLHRRLALVRRAGAGPERPGAGGGRAEAGQEPAGQRAGGGAGLRRRVTTPRRWSPPSSGTARPRGRSSSSPPRTAPDAGTALDHAGPDPACRSSRCRPSSARLRTRTRTSAGAGRGRAAAATARGWPRIWSTPRGSAGSSRRSRCGRWTCCPRPTRSLVVSDASQEFTAPEMAFLRQAAALCPAVVCVLTKTDVHQHWRHVAELDRAHLAAAGSTPGLPGLEPPRAARRAAAGPGAARGVRLRRPVRASAAGGRRPDRGAGPAGRSAHDLRSVDRAADALSLQTELAGAAGPGEEPAAGRELEKARARVDELGRQSSPSWQQLLNDGVTDLMADIDYDLRDRSRVIIREAEDTIEAEDPGPLWPDDRRLARRSGSPRPSPTARLGRAAVGLPRRPGDRAVHPGRRGRRSRARRRRPGRGPGRGCRRRGRRSPAT